MNYEEIITRLKEGFNSVADFAYDEYTEFDGIEFPDYHLDKYKITKTREDGTEYETVDFDQYQKDCASLIIPGGWEEIDSYGGEGQGETWYSIKYFPEHNIYIRVDGFYQSYNGTEFYDGWNCCSEVRPIEKTITVYE
jgi:hypothetical protein